MNAILKVWKSLAKLAESINRMADAIDRMTGDFGPLDVTTIEATETNGRGRIRQTVSKA